MLAGMQSRQPTIVFTFTVILGLLRLFAYAASPIGLELSVTALLHYVALHILTFTFAAFLVASLSRATATRAAFVALYAQAVLFLGAFVDVGLGLALTDYGQTYTGLFGGSPGSLLAMLAYGAVIAWGVYDATIGRRGPRAIGAVLAGVAGTLGMSFLAIPWPRVAEFVVHPWSLHLALAVYFSLLAAVFLCLAVRRANPRAFRTIWQQIEPGGTLAFAVLPLVGAVTADQLIAPLIPNAPPERYLVELPHVLAGIATGAALWVQWRLARAPDWGATGMEGARVAKVVALAFALPLGIVPFLAAAIAGSAAWLARVPRGGVVVGVVAALAVLVGNLAVAAVDSVVTTIGPVTFRVPINQNPSLSLEGIVVAAVAGVLVAVVSHFTSRTSASRRGRASS